LLQSAFDYSVALIEIKQLTGDIDSKYFKNVKK